MGHFLQLAVLVDREVFLAQSVDEAPARVRYRGGDVDQLDAGSETERPGVLIRLLRLQGRGGNNDGDDVRKGSGAHGHPQITGFRLSTCGTMWSSLRKL